MSLRMCTWLPVEDRRQQIRGGQTAPLSSYCCLGTLSGWQRGSTHTHTNTYTHTCMSTHVHIHTCSSTHTYTHSYTHARMHVHAHIQTCMNIHVPIDICSNTHIHTRASRHLAVGTHRPEWCQHPTTGQSITEIRADKQSPRGGPCTHGSSSSSHRIDLAITSNHIDANTLPIPSLAKTPARASWASTLSRAT